MFQNNARKGEGKDTDSSLPQSSIPSINLPKGGGAIRGIGEKFTANPVTGTGSLTVPIATSPGRSGFGPQLSISYDSGAGNGPFGIGWTLSLPAITRKTDKGLPRYRDEEDSDVFILSGAEDLVPALKKNPDGSWARDAKGNPVPDEYSRNGYLVRRYRPRIEGLFALIERWTRLSDGDTHWRSISKENVLTVYGATLESRIADPADLSRIFIWLICQSYDDKGNAIDYGYLPENDDNVDLSQVNERNRVRPANRHLKYVRYGNRESLLLDTSRPGFRQAHVPVPDLSGASWMFEVVFDYGEGHYQEMPPDPDGQILATASLTSPVGGKWTLRPDPFSSYRSCFEVRSYRLCRRVLMFHHFPDELAVDDYLVRCTGLKYLEKPNGSFISQVQQSGFTRLAPPDQHYLKRSLPPLDLEYTVSPLDDLSFDQLPLQEVDEQSLQNLPAGIDSGNYRWVDLDGEGISGVLSEQADAWFYKPNLGDGRFGPDEFVSPRPSLTGLNSGSQQLLDLEGDGNLDLVAFGAPTPGFFARTDTAGWDHFRTFPALPELDWRDPNLRFVDLTGDGHADILVTEDQAYCTWYESLAEQGFGTSHRVALPFDEESGPRLVFADGTQSVYLADMSGDGLSDLVRIRQSEVSYWPNIGYGRFGPKVTMDGVPWFDDPVSFHQRRVHLTDTDGSGPTDIVYLGRDGVRVYLNQHGNALSEARLLSRVPRTTDLTAVSVVDFLGRGTACLLWSSPLPGDARRPLRYLDLMGGVKPHLLKKVSNNLGAETLVEYQSSTQFYLADKAAGRPWATRLPFPVHVVTRVESSDLVSNTTLITSYRYRHGYFDGVEREFRGFAYVEQRDAETLVGAFDLPPVVTKTWFHTGAFLEGDWLEAYFRNPANREYYTGDPQAVFLPDTELPSGLGYEEMREAARALKGSILRQEIYADDGSAKAALPYSVSERSYRLNLLQPQGRNRYAVFFNHPCQTIDYHYERNAADPRLSHAFTLSVDNYGNVLKSVAIGYPRRVPAFDEQKKTLATLTETLYTNPVLEDDAYRAPLPAEVKTCELTTPSLKGANPLDFAMVDAAAAAAAEIAYETQPTPGQTQKRVIEQMRTIYRKNDLSALLATGKLEALALPGESYKLALTPGLLDIFQGKASRAELTNILTGAEGRYRNLDGNPQLWIPSGQTFFSPTFGDSPQQELSFALAHFFLPHRFQDPFGNTTTVAYDGKYNLLLVSTQDAVGSLVVASQDYRVLRPKMVTDPNGNRAEARFDALGMLAGTAMRGKAVGAVEGDSFDDFATDLTPRQIKDFFDATDPRPLALDHLGTATTRIVYDLDRVPACASSIARETHVSDLAHGDPTKVQVSFVYSDGFGREAQTKVQAEPGPLDPNDSASPVLDPRWVGTGSKVYSNKGKPIRQYEPFFSPTSHFGIEKQGVSSTLFYDPVSRVVATLHPNNIFEKVVFDPWQQTTWDVNDTVTFDPKNDPDAGDFFIRLSDAEYLPTWYQQRVNGGKGPDEKAAADKAAKHADTPTVAHFDTLGRTFMTIADNAKDAGGNDQKFRTRTMLDIEGNQRQVIDALDRIVMKYDYDMLGTRIHQASMEAGERWMLNDATGKPIRAWNSRKYAFRTEYDPLHRPLRSFVTGGDPSEANPKLLPQEILMERTIYGESADTGLSNLQQRQANLRGRVYRHFDGAGIITSDSYDFKGNLLGSSRQFASDYKNAPDWSQNPALETGTFNNSIRYDALNRPITVTAPDQSIYRPTFNEANLLDKVDVNLRGAASATSFVANIDYNAKGQRSLIQYGSGVQTSYEYDAQTFRLTHLNTTRTPGSPDIGSQIFNAAAVVQDLRYVYDPVGNITQISDAALQTVFNSNQQIDPVCTYSYDALYRLIEATGREHVTQASFLFDPPEGNYRDYPFAGATQLANLKALRNYTEQYQYDPVGNFEKMIHQATNGAWSRNYTYDESSPLEPVKKSNRLSQTALQTSGNPTPEQYHYDAHGNMTQMPHLPIMQWDFRDQLCASARQVVNAGTPETTFYVYDAGGQRARKVTERQNGTRKNERIYTGGFEVYCEYLGNGTDVALQRETLHVMDDKQRIALVETKTIGSGIPIKVPVPAQRYQLGNHLGSASLELDEAGGLISYEEYLPYGSTSFQAGSSAAEVSLKRYRYTGKERDDETGFSYHGARYYAPWLGRWTACDPAGISKNPYEYVSSRPLVLIDKTGLSGSHWIDIPLLDELAAAIDSNLNRAARNKEPPSKKDEVNIPLAVAKEAVTSAYDVATGAPAKVAVQAAKTWQDEFVAAVVTPNSNEATAHGVKAVGAAVRFTAASLRAYEEARRKVATAPPSQMAPDPDTPPDTEPPAAPASEKPPNGPYSARDQRQGYEDASGKENVTSTTVPPDNHPSLRKKAVEWEGKSIGFDERGRPDFDAVTKFKARVESGLSPDAEMSAATRQLRDLLGGGNSLNDTVFTSEQMQAIRAGDKTIPGFTWEHTHGTELSLVPSGAHKAAQPHIGSRALREGR